MRSRRFTAAVTLVLADATTEELDAERKQAQAEKRPYKYSRRCLIDPPKVCKPTVCRVLKPAVAPPVVAPSGCRQARVCGGRRDCRWELVCQ